LKGVIQCPVLREYVCPICKATGDKAHTMSYCKKATPTTVGLSMKKLKKMRCSLGANRM
jgi:hypothetical protein